MATEAKPKRRRAVWYLWWQVDSFEVARQVAAYDSLKLWQSARGVSMLLMMGSNLLTVAIILVTQKNFFGFVDVVIGVAIGLCMLGKNLWSKIAAMVYWSLEKLLLVVAAVIGPSHGIAAFSQVIFWAVFMRFFYLAYQVERERRRPAVDAAAVFG